MPEAGSQKKVKPFSAYLVKGEREEHEKTNHWNLGKYV